MLHALINNTIYNNYLILFASFHCTCIYLFNWYIHPDKYFNSTYGLHIISFPDLGENIIISPSAPKVAQDSPVTLTCHLPDALPSPNVSWLKDGVPFNVRYDRRVKVINQDNFSQVVIRQAWTSDSGYYSCQVSNPVGKRSDKVKLNVYGKYKKYITI